MNEPQFSSSSDRLPPQNIEAEEDILGGILLDPEAISRVAELLQPESFALKSHQIIYRATLTLHSQGKPTDLMTVTTWLADQKLLEQVGGQLKLTQLVDRTVSAVNIDQYGLLVVAKKIRRSLITGGHTIIELAYDTSQDLETVLDKAEQQIFNISQVRPQQDLVSIGETLIDTFQEIEDRNEGISLPGIPCGFYDLDALTGGFQRSDLIIIAGRPSMGKCLSFDSKIVLSDGSVVTIEDIYNRQKAQILTLENNWKFKITEPSDFIDDGIKPVFRVTTKLGRFVESTITHPFLTIQGWRPLGEIKPGDKIAVPRQFNSFGSEKLPEYQVKILGYLLGDGGLTNINRISFKDSPKSTPPSPPCQVGAKRDNYRIKQDFVESIQQLIENKPEIYPLLTKGRVRDGLVIWMETIGFWGKNSHQKTIPEIIFKLERSQIALFLNRLFATDGWATILASGQCQLGYGSVSEELARQVQHLLLRFGIIATLKKRSVKYKETIQTAWQLDITDALSIKIFISEIGIFSKEEALLKIENALMNKRYQTNRDLIPIEIWQEIATVKGDESWQSLAKRAGIPGYSNIHVGKRQLSRERLWSLATTLDNLPLQQLATSEIYWDEIVSIEFMGEKQVYDLTIPETHNFVANDICVHNTSFAVGLGHNIAKGQKLPIAVFSLEMSKGQLVQRLLSSEAKIESNRIRSGRISQSEWEPLTMAISSLAELPIFIDDTPNITVTEMRSKARRLQAENGGVLGLILIDYLQLMEGASDNRVQELSRITRSLKGLARELSVPVIALSQLSRSVESRTNKRPMLSDLRESGCLTGDSLITLADTGLQVPIKELIGKSGFPVWALNEETMKLETAIVSNAFSTGIKPVFTLTTRLGRKIRATANHKFLTIQGWKRLDELSFKQHICLPRYLSISGKQTMTCSEVALLGHLIGDGCTLPRHVIQYTTREIDLAENVAFLSKELFGDAIVPRISPERDWYQVYLPATQHLTHGVRNPIAKWLDSLGIFGLRSHEKFVPQDLFSQPQELIACFLRHLWSTDGSIKLVAGKKPRPTAYYASSSQRLAFDVQTLLLRLGINATLRMIPQPGKGRDQYHVTITGKIDLELFIQKVGAVGEYKLGSLQEISEHFENCIHNPNRDVIPKEVWKNQVVPAMQIIGMTTREIQSRLGQSYCGSTLYKANLSRERALKVANIVQSNDLLALSNSDVYWDEIVSIIPDGEEEVFDLTVPRLHNFVANNIIVHNSIEQDADLVMMIYRDDYYNPDTPDRGITEIIMAKHRNGPTGTIKLLFDPQFTKFRNLANPRSS
ncbi:MULTISPECIES: replicative DNA helicase [Planktothrix]|uniref:replicative DNA helicase n=1 Tax=Planktothrix TaxID=54304 RepID=UPI0003F4F653|nr:MULTISPECIES: replicative DNA helicase [Planktothrix]